MKREWDAIVVGAGAAGLYCALTAGRRHRRVLILDHAAHIAEKIRISGGGRCNFTNRDLPLKHPEQFYLSENPRFAKSALARYTPQDFIAEMTAYGLGFHEKHKGQLFCNEGSEAIIEMLLNALKDTPATLLHPVEIESIESGTRGYTLNSSTGTFESPALVIATGGLSIPKIGATDFGYRIAKQFGHRIIEPRPALVPLQFDAALWDPYRALAGISLPVHISLKGQKPGVQFDEDLLFTHRGLSGPAILQISSYWSKPDALVIDLLPRVDLLTTLLEFKKGPGKKLETILTGHLPARLVATWIHQNALDPDVRIQDLKDKVLSDFVHTIKAWEVSPTGSEGFKKAEVTRGGVDTADISSKTMESLKRPGLYFIGEVVDVTGWLGGYNFQWAWASAHAAGSVI